MPVVSQVEFWRVVFTGVAAAAAIAAVIVSLAARRNARRSAAAAERSAAAGEKSAATAEEALRQARKAATTAAEGTRARIVFRDPPETSENLRDAPRLIFWPTVTIVNTGKIPAARRTSRHAHLATGTFAWPDDDSSLYTVERKAPLPSGEQDVIREIIEIERSEFSAVQAGALGLYAFGVEEYETLGEERRMSWCVQYHPPSHQFTYRADLSTTD